MTINIGLKQYFFSKKWFKSIFKKSFFFKVNNLWRKYSTNDIPLIFKEGENIQESSGPGITNWIYCQNNECKSIVNAGSFTGEKKVENEIIWTFECTCCKKIQYFIPDLAVIPCDEHGKRV